MKGASFDIKFVCSRSEVEVHSYADCPRLHIRYALHVEYEIARNFCPLVGEIVDVKFGRPTITANTSSDAGHEIAVDSVAVNRNDVAVCL